MNNDLEYSEIVSMLKDHAETIAFDMMNDCKKRGKYLYGDCHGKASVHISGGSIGTVGFWQGQRASSQGGNLIHLIEISMGMAKHGEAVRYAKKHYLGIEDRPFTEEEKREWAQRREKSRANHERAEQQRGRDKQKRISAVQEVWSAAIPVSGTPAEVYLTKRVRAQDFPPSIKFHKSLFCEMTKSNHPALIAGVQSVDRVLIAVWRIFLNEDGTNLLHDGEKVKMGFGPSSGGVVRLTPVHQEWNVGEGLESTLCAQALNDQRGAWASALSTSGLRGLILPDGVKRLNIWSDGDRYKFRKGTQDDISSPPGQSAAMALKQKVEPQGVEVFIHEPPPGSDWADVWEARSDG